MQCNKCGKEIESSGIGTGYATNNKYEKICYSCCGIIDAEELRENGKLFGYFTYKTVKHTSSMKTYEDKKFTNWPGTFTIPVYHMRVSRNNFGAERRDFWFNWEGRNYWGVSIGDNECARVRKVK